MNVDPTDEVRPASCKFDLKTTWIALNLLNRPLGESKAGRDRPSRLPHAFAEGILDTEPASHGNVG